MKGREESSMHLYSMKYGNDQILLVYTRSSASSMPCYFNSYEYEISWSVLRFFATIVFIGCFTGQHSNWLCFERSNDQSPPHWRMVSLTTKYQPVMDCLLCTLARCVCTWLGSCQPRAAMACHHLLSIQVSNAFSYDIFCSPLLNTISPPLS